MILDESTFLRNVPPDNLPVTMQDAGIAFGKGEDPWVVAGDDGYYYCKVDDAKRQILLGWSSNLLSLTEVELETVWQHEGPHTEIWAPELHFIGSLAVLYYSTDPNGDNRHYRPHVAVMDMAAGALPVFVNKGELQLPDEGEFAIDHTLVTLNGEDYLVYSGWEGSANDFQHLYITRLENPWTAGRGRFCIASPTYDWEKPVNHEMRGVNEGPQQLVSTYETPDGPRNRHFIVYSANGSWSNDYCLGMVEYTPGKDPEHPNDPCNPTSWTKHPEPVFSSSDEIFGPGHASFITSPDGKQHYMIYHHARVKDGGWDRVVMAQEFTFDEMGYPIFGAPVCHSNRGI
jgi:GH43 family beta-xylosidase